jgi:hypothetical protein
MNLFKRSADRFVNLILQRGLNFYLSGQRITEPNSDPTVRLDSIAHTLHLNVHLRGEVTETEIIISYSISNEQKINIYKIESSKEWVAAISSSYIPVEGINIALNDVLPEKLFNISSGILLHILR